jgi:hypothetical protein
MKKSAGSTTTLAVLVARDMRKREAFSIVSTYAD